MYYITSTRSGDAQHTDILSLSQSTEGAIKADAVHHWLLHYGMIDPQASLQQTRADYQMLRDVRRGVQNGLRILWSTLFKALAVALAAIIGLGLHSYLQQIMSMS